MIFNIAIRLTRVRARALHNNIVCLPAKIPLYFLKTFDLISHIEVIEVAVDEG